MADSELLNERVSKLLLSFILSQNILASGFSRGFSFDDLRQCVSDVSKHDFWIKSVLEYNTQLS